MKAHLFLPALLLVLGGAASAPAEAQEFAVTLGGARGALQLSAGEGGLGVRAVAYGQRRRGIERGRPGREIRIDYRDHRHVCVTRSVWVPGHYESRERRVFVPGHREKVWIEPVYVDGFDDCGRPTRRLVRQGHWDVVQHPGHHERRWEPVWVPGHYERRGCCD